MSEASSSGPLTGVRLDDVSPLLLPWRAGPFGQLMPPRNGSALRLSAELAAVAYSLEVTPWLQSGWRDVTVQMENHLQEGVDAPQEEQAPTRMERLAAVLKRPFQRLDGARHDAFSTMAGTLRQLRHESDTGKVLVMLHPTADGRYVVAVGFMGTARPQDWVANLRMSIEEEAHQGFLQLTRQFENNEREIHFPETARELGLDRLTLADILAEAAHPGSRFLLWVVGHSQGGALVQLYLHRKLHLDGVVPRNLLGYAFASPRAVTGRFTQTPAAYPLYLIENSDDPVPRSGANMHLGVRLVYPANDDLRETCYAWPRDEVSARNRLLVRPILNGMTDMPRILETMEAYLTVLSELPVEENIDALNWVPLLQGPAKKLALAADSRFDAVLAQVSHRCRAAHAEIAGREMDEERVAATAGAIRRVTALIGFKAFNTALTQLAKAPHTMGPKPGAAMPVYAYIAMQAPFRLVPWAWRPGEEPVQVPGSPRRTRLPRREAARLPIRRPHGGAIPARTAPKRRPDRTANSEGV